MDPNVQHAQPGKSPTRGRRTLRPYHVVIALAVVANPDLPLRFEPGGQSTCVVFARPPKGRRQRAARPPTPLIESSAPTANLFARAEEGIARRDWKLAIDSLQRIIDDEAGSLVPKPPEDIDSNTGLVYESARRRALRWIAEFEPEALRAYRLLYDGRAKGLLDRAKLQGESADLKTIVDRYLLTRYGDDAADLLASWMLDIGRPTEALRVIQDLRELVPDYDVPEHLIVGKLAAAYAMQGRIEEAKSVVDSFRSSESDGPRDAQATPPLSSAGAMSWLDDVVSIASPTDRRTGNLTFGPTSWPMAGGTAARLGRMAPVEPDLVGRLPWQFAMRGAAAKAWKRTKANGSAGVVPLPAAQLVADEHRIFVRTPYGCTALDAEDLSVVWSVPEDDADRDRPGAARRSARRPIVDPEILRNRVFEDYVSESITVADGLVMIVQRSTEPIVWRAGEVRPSSIPRRFREAHGEGVDPTALVAFDADSGDVRWWRGRTFNVADPLGEVEFRSVPIVVDDALWVPYLQKNDLFVAALDPTDGSVVHNILLCSLDRPALRTGDELSPAYSDGTVFVPSGHGVLFAVDARKGRLRWANRYLSDFDRGGGSQRDSSSTWLSAPPIVSRGLVLLASPSKSELMAFDAATGDLRWSSPVQSASYMIAVDGERIWLGGDGVTCLSLTDGQLDWNAAMGVASTGRAVLAGNLIYIPTADGLVTVDALSGEVLGRRPLPPGVPPLGNLLALRSRLFSVDPSGVRMYPDLSRLYPQALARHKEDTNDLRLSVRLAWMEILRNAPGRALQVLDETSHALAEPLESLQESAAHVRTEALLALADQPDRVAAESLDLLRQAVRAALTPTDRLRSVLALADRLATLDHYHESFLALWKIGLSVHADDFVSLRDNVRGSAREVVSGRLQQISAKLSADERAKIDQLVDQEVAAAVDGLKSPASEREAARRLRAAADMDRAGPAGQHALIALANWRQQQGQIEWAEQLLFDAARSNERTESDHPAHEPFILTEKVAWSLRVSTGTRRQVTTHGPFEIPAELQRSLQAIDNVGPPRTVRLDSGDPLSATDLVVFYAAGDVLYGQHALSGKLAWSTQLRLPDQLTEQVSIFRGPRIGRSHRALTDGQTAVFNGVDALHGVGYVTGKRLWVRPYEQFDTSGGYARRDTAMAARDGYLAALPGEGQLALMRMADGTSVWEHDLHGRAVEYIWMTDKLVITADKFLQHVQVFDRRNGARTREILFKQPDTEQVIVRLIQMKSLLCGPQCSDQSDDVVAVDLDTGQTVWRTELNKPLATLFDLQEDRLGIGLLGGDVRIVNAISGETMFEGRVPGANIVFGGLMTDDTLILRHTAAGESRVQMTAIDLSTGNDLWNRDDLAAATRSLKLDTSGELLPVVAGEFLPKEHDKPRKGKELMMLDIRTGTSVGPSVGFPAGGAGAKFNGDLAVFDSSIVIGTTHGIHSLRTEPLPDTTENSP